MSRKSRIAVVLASLGLVLATVSPMAFAGSPLLSGYGGPGAGEQAVIGSTLIGGGGAGSGGSSGSSGSSGSGSSGSVPTAGGSASNTTSAVTGGSSAGGFSGGSGGKGASSAGHPHGSPRGAGSTSNHSATSNTRAQVHAFVYPTGPRSTSADSPALGISGTDLLLLLAALATLTLVAVATLRLSRLQREL